jgi:hypothetical protein
MERRCLCAAAVLAALVAIPLHSLAQSETLQDPRRDQWALLSERGSKDTTQGQGLRTLLSDAAFGAEIGWLRTSDLKPGAGLQLDIAQSWALSADWDRYRPKTPLVRETVDTFLLGFQYRFR